jgi:uncharacterized protein YodC (DUF2158 family)
MSIAIGSIVWLKSGSPKMTVSSKIYNGDYKCHWFVGDELKQGDFSESELTKEMPVDDKKTDKEPIKRRSGDNGY